MNEGLPLADAPFVRVKVVGAIAQIVDKSEGVAAIGDADVAALYIGGQDYRLAPQILQGLVEGKFLGKRRAESHFFQSHVSAAAAKSPISILRGALYCFTALSAMARTSSLKVLKIKGSKAL